MGWHANSNLSRGLLETFGYDDLNRLTSTRVANQPAVTIYYDAFGNITSDSGTRLSKASSNH